MQFPYIHNEKISFSKVNVHKDTHAEDAMKCKLACKPNLGAKWLLITNKAVFMI